MPLKRLMNNKELAKKLNRMIQYDKYTLITVCITIIFTLYLLNLIPTKVKGTKIKKERIKMKELLSSNWVILVLFTVEWKNIEWGINWKEAFLFLILIFGVIIVKEWGR